MRMRAGPWHSFIRPSEAIMGYSMHSCVGGGVLLLSFLLVLLVVVHSAMDDADKLGRFCGASTRAFLRCLMTATAFLCEQLTGSRRMHHHPSPMPFKSSMLYNRSIAQFCSHWQSLWALKLSVVGIHPSPRCCWYCSCSAAAAVGRLTVVHCCGCTPTSWTRGQLCVLQRIAT